MSREINHALRTAANASDLKYSAMPIFICDENLRLCMYSESFANMMPRLVLGKDMSALFPSNMRRMINEMSDTCQSVMLDLPQYKNSALVIAGHYNKERYTAVILDGNTHHQSLEGKPYLKQAALHIAKAVDTSLHQKRSDDQKFLLRCDQLNRLRRYSQFCDPSQKTPEIYTDDCTELVPYVSTIIDGFNQTLASLGCTFTLTKDSPHVFHGACSRLVLGSVVTTLIAAVLCLSSDGNVQIKCTTSPDDYKKARIAISAVKPCQPDLPSSFQDLIDRLTTLKLDLLAIFDIASYYSFDLSCGMIADGSFEIAFTVPFAKAGSVTFHSPALNVETVFAKALIEQLSSMIRSDLHFTHTATVNSNSI